MIDHPGELKIPQVAKADKDAKEFIRIWSSGGAQQIILKRDMYDDAAAWDLCLADIARHVSNAYAQKGYDQQEIFDRILLGFRIEIENPTDDPTGDIQK